MRVATLFIAMVAAVLIVSCSQQVKTQPQTDSTLTAPERVLQADIAWERLDLGAVDFGSLDLESLEDELTIIEASIE
ncbi:hypothetical protein HY641_01650 [Candidatus Woesearchaeota archaeon]|nr:hypothetical protein [Candidatus Woesearchaeota archaeon]